MFFWRVSMRSVARISSDALQLRGGAGESAWRRGTSLEMAHWRRPTGYGP